MNDDDGAGQTDKAIITNKWYDRQPRSLGHFVMLLTGRSWHEIRPEGRKEGRIEGRREGKKHGGKEGSYERRKERSMEGRRRSGDTKKSVD